MTDKGGDSRFFIRNHDVFCSQCGDWIELPRTSTIREAVKEARKLGFTKKRGRMLCEPCLEQALNEEAEGGQ